MTSTTAVLNSVYNSLGTIRHHGGNEPTEQDRKLNRQEIAEAARRAAIQARLDGHTPHGVIAALQSARAPTAGFTGEPVPANAAHPTAAEIKELNDYRTKVANAEELNARADLLEVYTNQQIDNYFWCAYAKGPVSYTHLTLPTICSV